MLSIGEHLTGITRLTDNLLRVSTAEKAYYTGKNIEFDSDWVVVVKGVYEGKIGRIVSVRWNCCCDIEAEAEIDIITDEGYSITVINKEIRRMDKL